MLSGGPDVSLPRLLLGGVVIVGLLTLIVAGSSSSAAFGTYNAGWDGASGVRAAAADTGGSVMVLTETTPYEDAGAGTIAIVLAPTEPYSDAEIDRLRGFLDRQGTLIVAEDVGPGGNRLLDRIGADVRFDGRLVVDQRHHGPTPEMPLATNVTASSTTRGVDAVMLNHGTVLTNTTNASVLVRTSTFAYLDTDANRALNDEPLRSYPVVATESVGGGTVVTVSDPSVFINAMQDRASNAAFLRALVDDDSRILLDYSHSDSQPPIRAGLLWLRRTPSVVGLVGVVGVLAVAYAVRGRTPSDRPNDSER